MASLRLALKASLEESGNPPPPSRGRTNNNQSQSSLSSSSSLAHEKAAHSQNRKRSYSEASASSTGDETSKNAALKKKTPKKATTALDEGKGKGSDKKQTPQHSSKMKEKELPSSSLSSSAELTPPRTTRQASASSEQKDQSVSNKKNSSTADKNSVSPAVPSKTKTEVTTVSNKKRRNDGISTAPEKKEIEKDDISLKKSKHKDKSKVPDASDGLVSKKDVIEEKLKVSNVAAEEKTSSQSDGIVAFPESGVKPTSPIRDTKSKEKASPGEKRNTPVKKHSKPGNQNTKVDKKQPKVKHEDSLPNSSALPTVVESPKLEVAESKTSDDLEEESKNSTKSVVEKAPDDGIVNPPELSISLPQKMRQVDENAVLPPKATSTEDSENPPPGDGQAIKKSIPTSTIEKTPGKRTPKEGGDTYQSPRAAAQVAKSRLSLTGTNKQSKSVALANANKSDDSVSKPTPTTQKKCTTPKDAKVRKKDKEVIPDHWVACDECGKWRRLPGSVDISSLPEKWYCSMNYLDEHHNNCAHEEEVYVDPSTEPTFRGRIPKSDSKDGSTGNDIDSGKKKASHRDVRSTRGKRPGRDEDSSDTEESRRDVVRGLRPGMKRKPRGQGGDVGIKDVVKWVQCNKCSKWRKVPSNLENSLPDVWYCAMNTWSPELARCSAKEEADDTMPARTPAREKKAATTGRGKYLRTNKKSDLEISNLSGPFPAPGKTIVRKIQWVQCERKNCKKWRKIPIEVDLSSLPEKWYCEMNEWDPERAACYLAEDSDDEGDQPANHAARTQLILGNAKGPGALSYRRLIFGADGRIRSLYSEKNKNGYGIFSFTEVYRPTDAEDYLMPTRRVSYWWSSCYDSSVKPQSKDSSAKQPSKKGSNGGSDEAESREAPEVVFQTDYSSFRPDETSDLMDCISRMQSFGPQGSGATRTAMKPHKQTLPFKKQCSLFHRIQLACSVVQSYLMVFAGHPQPLTFDEIFFGLSSHIYFHSPELEQCRESMGRGELWNTLRRLDQKGTVEATYDNDGDLSFRLCLQRCAEHDIPDRPNPCPALVARHEPTPLAGKSVPLKMRKRKIGLQSLKTIPQSISSSSFLSEVAPSKESLPVPDAAVEDLPAAVDSSAPNVEEVELGTQVDASEARE